MKFPAAALLLALTAAPVLVTPVLAAPIVAVPIVAAPLPVSCAAPRAAFTVQDGALVAFSGQADATGQPGATERNGGGRNRGDRDGVGQGGGGRDEPSGRSDRVIIKGKGGKVTGVERKPGPGGERDTGSPPRQ